MTTRLKPPPTVWLNLRDVCDRFRVSGTMIWRWRQLGQFPEPHRLGRRAVRWHVDDIVAFEARAAARQGEAVAP